MKAVIFCGGKGTRLYEETEFKPKPLVQVGNMPILWHVMKLYASYGVKEFILCLGYKGNMIKEYFLNFEEMSNDFTLTLRSCENKVMHHCGSSLEDWSITFKDTGLENQTGSRLSKIKELIGDDEDFFLTYGDCVSDVDIDDLLDFHKKKGTVLTLTGVQPVSPFGMITVKNGLVETFKEKPKLKGIINGGFFVCNKKVFDYVSDDIDCVFEEKPMETLASEGQLAVYEHSGFWYAMDTQKHVNELNVMWSSGNPPWKIWDKQRGDY